MEIPSYTVTRMMSAGEGDIAQVDLVDHRGVRKGSATGKSLIGNKREHQEAHHLHHQVFTKPR
jgi:hypothetical protein